MKKESVRCPLCTKPNRSRLRGCSSASQRAICARPAPPLRHICRPWLWFHRALKRSNQVRKANQEQEGTAQPQSDVKHFGTTVEHHGGKQARQTPGTAVHLDSLCVRKKRGGEGDRESASSTARHGCTL